MINYNFDKKDNTIIFNFGGANNNINLSKSINLFTGFTNKLQFKKMPIEEEKKLIDYFSKLGLYNKIDFSNLKDHKIDEIKELEINQKKYVNNQFKNNFNKYINNLNKLFNGILPEKYINRNYITKEDPSGFFDKIILNDNKISDNYTNINPENFINSKDVFKTELVDEIKKKKKKSRNYLNEFKDNKNYLSNKHRMVDLFKIIVSEEHLGIENYKNICDKLNDPSWLQEFFHYLSIAKYYNLIDFDIENGIDSFYYNIRLFLNLEQKGGVLKNLVKSGIDKLKSGRDKIKSGIEYVSSLMTNTENFCFLGNLFFVSSDVVRIVHLKGKDNNNIEKNFKFYTTLLKLRNRHVNNLKNTKKDNTDTKIINEETNDFLNLGGWSAVYTVLKLDASFNDYNFETLGKNEMWARLIVESLAYSYFAFYVTKPKPMTEFECIISSILDKISKIFTTINKNNKKDDLRKLKERVLNEVENVKKDYLKDSISQTLGPTNKTPYNNFKEKFQNQIEETSFKDDKNNSLISNLYIKMFLFKCIELIDEINKSKNRNTSTGKRKVMDDIASDNLINFDNVGNYIGRTDFYNCEDVLKLRFNDSSGIPDFINSELIFKKKYNIILDEYSTYFKNNKIYIKLLEGTNLLGGSQLLPYPGHPYLYYVKRPKTVSYLLHENISEEEKDKRRDLILSAIKRRQNKPLVKEQKNKVLEKYIPSELEHEYNLKNAEFINHIDYYIEYFKCKHSKFDVYIENDSLLKKENNIFSTFKNPLDFLYELINKKIHVLEETSEDYIPKSNLYETNRFFSLSYNEESIYRLLDICNFDKKKLNEILEKYVVDFNKQDISNTDLSTSNMQTELINNIHYYEKNESNNLINRIYKLFKNSNIIDQFNFDQNDDIVIFSTFGLLFNKKKDERLYLLESLINLDYELNTILEKGVSIPDIASIGFNLESYNYNNEKFIINNSDNKKIKTINNVHFNLFLHPTNINYEYLINQLDQANVFFNLLNYINISLTSLINDNWYFNKIDKNNIIEEDENLSFKIKNTFEEVMKDKKNLSKKLKDDIKFKTNFHFSKNDPQILNSATVSVIDVLKENIKEISYEIKNAIIEQGITLNKIYK